MHEGVLLDGAARLLLVQGILCGGAVRGRRCDVGDLLGVGMLATNLGDANVTGLASLGERVVAAVEVLALLHVVVSM